jgi:hypothetical protein
MIIVSYLFLIFGKSLSEYSPMKIPSLLIILSMLAAGSRGQVTIQSADLPAANDIYYMSNGVAFPGMDPTLTGAGYAWDFSQLTYSSQSVDTIYSIAATNPLFSFYFIDNPFNPNRSNHAYKGPDITLGTVAVTDVFNFYYNSSASYKQTGFGATVNGAPIPIGYAPHDVIYNFPVEYNDQDSSSSAFQVDLTATLGLFFGVERTRRNLVDGWGTVITPLGTFNALRLRSEITEVDSVYIDSLGFGITLPPIVTTEYKWLSPGEGVPVLQVNANAAGTITGIVYKDTLNTTSIASAGTGIELEVFPNPSFGEIKIRFTDVNVRNAAVSIIGSSGGVVSSFDIDLDTGSTSTIDLKSLGIAPGSYYLIIRAGERVYTRPFYLSE